MKLSFIDNNNDFDWGKTSSDYSKYRPGYPESFYNLMLQLGVGKPNQRILDLGTGTGVLARAFAQRGSKITGIDISQEQIDEAKKLSEAANLNVEYIVGNAEDYNFPQHFFDIASSGQSWLYFNPLKMLENLRNTLVPNGKLVLTHLSWLPFEDTIAKQTEALVLKYNPSWNGANYKSNSTPFFESLKHLPLYTYHRYSEAIPFTRESWKGRIRACRGIGATLAPEDITNFDKEHDILLRSIANSTFTVLHEITLHIYGVV
jgi:ubiquinone/menaquinone biosynthesis C-methylase UbiE